MNGLTSKQLSIVSKYNITVRQDDYSKDFFFFIDGDYYQQKGNDTELDAYLAGITFVLNRKK
ncbi:MAG: hypothetical protein ACK5LF_03560 [Bacteroides xylanisolvens]